MTVTLTGFMGSGKSSTGRELSALLAFPFTDLDEYMEHKTGHSIPELFSKGEDYFRAVEAEAVRDIISMDRVTGENRVLSLGGGTFTTGPIRDLLLENTMCVYLKTSLETCLGRITDHSSRPLLDVPGLYAKRLPLYGLSPICVETEGRTPAEVALEIRLKMNTFV